MQIKAYDITKLLHVVTAELKSSVNRPLYRNKIKAITLFVILGVATGSK